MRREAIVKEALPFLVPLLVVLILFRPLVTGLPNLVLAPST
ncbi:hypothetical protein [Mesorhizobium sp.]|nr:hypothetical protein [Mesorhizobium sp.]